MAYVENVDLIPEEARSLGSGTVVSSSNFGGSTQVILHLRVIAASGSVSVKLEDSIDGENWFTVGTVSAAAGSGYSSAPGNTALRLATPFTDNLRVTWTVMRQVTTLAGTATFAVSLAAF